jgi:hypothetical protein
MEFLLRDIDNLFVKHRGGGKLSLQEERSYGRDEATVKKAAIEAFASINGWIAGDSYCHPAMLGKRNRMPREYGSIPSFYDHYFGCRKDGKNIAIVTQPYQFSDAERSMAINRGLELHLPPDPMASIYYPGRTFFIVVTRPGVTVEWLPEQDGRMMGKWKA